MATVFSMTEAMTGDEIQCPRCNSYVLYRYGRNPMGKQRFLCLMCGRQFAPEATRIEVKEKPVCPKCGRPMHLYKKEETVVRFRCSNYPECKTFLKKNKEEE
ncbi:MAG TPA: IS1 family transposase [Dissulfurispiraceae bacterium]|nr:IS1 family transposase [Dissulfurispiraceae bacterium]